MVQQEARPKRNRNGVGTVRQLRDTLFQGSIQLAPGNRRYVSGHTRQEAEQKPAELRVPHQQGRLPERSQQTVGQFAAYRADP